MIFQGQFWSLIPDKLVEENVSGDQLMLKTLQVILDGTDGHQL